jgi:hypothetical protein
MGGTWKRRGPTWQDGDWRRLAMASEDLGERARIAFARLRGLRAEAIAKPKADQHSCARTPAPFIGDGTPAEGPFVVRPEYRGFA